MKKKEKSNPKWSKRKINGKKHKGDKLFLFLIYGSNFYYINVWKWQKKTRSIYFTNKVFFYTHEMIFIMLEYIPKRE